MLHHFWERYRTWFFIAGTVLLLAGGFLFYPGDRELAPDFPAGQPVYAQSAQDQKTFAPSVLEEYYVDVKGSVKHPGVYQLTPGKRVRHAVDMAGGFLPDADLDRVNLAQPVTDGMVIRIPAKSDASSHSGEAAVRPVGSSDGNSYALAPSPHQVVNLNEASLQQLLTLPGIGETRAKAILAFREQHGPFQNPEQLKQVTGIGEKVFEQLKPLVEAP